MRVTATEVKEILDNSTLTDTIVDAYILGANSLVNSALGTGDTALLKEIERWMAAHMIASSRERMAQKEGAGGAYIEYTGTSGQELSSTPYGQMVITLDTSGAMASLGLKKASIYAVKSFD